MPVSISDLLKVVELARTWLEQVLTKERTRQEQDAARLLKSAGLVVAALGALDNTIPTTGEKLDNPANQAVDTRGVRL